MKCDGFLQSEFHEQKVYEESCIQKPCACSISEFEMYMFKTSCSYFWMGSSGDELRDVLAWQYAHASTDQRGAGTF